jgi:hypothetical protein
VESRYMTQPGSALPLPSSTTHFSTDRQVELQAFHTHSSVTHQLKTLNSNTIINMKVSVFTSILTPSAAFANVAVAHSNPWEQKCKGCTQKYYFCMWVSSSSS